MALATAIAYAGWLGWDQTKEVGADGRLHGPYQAWQVIGLALTLALIAAAGGWRHWPWTAAVVMTIAFTLIWSINAVTDAGNNSLWVVGAGMVAIGTLGGAALVAFLAEAIETRKNGLTCPSTPFTSR